MIQEFQPWQQFVLRVLLLILGAGVIIVAYFFVHNQDTVDTLGAIGALLIIATSGFRRKLENPFNFFYVICGIMVAVAMGVLSLLFPSNPNANNVLLAAILIALYVCSRLFW